MSATKNACLKYVKATATIFFPDGEVKCRLCPCMETYARPQCRLTGEYLAEGYLIGGMCPLNFETEDYNAEP